MTCKCGSSRILSVSGKVGDMCDVRIGDDSYSGYVPSGLNIGGGDYLEFRLCLDCGQHQGAFPVKENTVSEAF